eukprot:2323254-Pleurochrysis_carterae.AAC.1
MAGKFQRPRCKRLDQKRRLVAEKLTQISDKCVKMEQQTATHNQAASQEANCQWHRSARD